MFEQSLVAEGHHVGRSAVTLPVSLALHAVAVTVALFAAVWQVSFPNRSPDQFEPLKIGPALSVPAPSQPRQLTPPRPAAAHPVVARVDVPPSTIPDATPQLQPPAAGPVELSTTNIVDSSAPIGDGLPGIAGTGTATGESEVSQPPLPVGGDVKRPEVITRVDPPYPPLAMKMRLNGLVIVTAIIDRYGNVVNVSVLKSSHPLFEQAAVDAVQRWKFKAGTLHGRAVDTIFNLTVSFHLN